jgi:hypothetical protein
MPRYSKPEDFDTGLAVLSPFFESRGFTLTRAKPFVDRDGYILKATFLRAPRAVEFEHQYSLGRVVYHMGDFSIEHTPYLEALGVALKARYPTYEDNSHAGYPALLHDLQNLLTPFFEGSERDFIDVASRPRTPPPKGIHAV